jgi:formylglycine-generating enzyme required for sulfatase activity
VGSELSASSAPPPTVAPSASAPAASAPASASNEAAKQLACPEGMVLVDGTYCPSLKMKCLKEWHAPQNHLWVCERFEPPTVCEGAQRPMRFCIDRYEFPNRKGQRPMVMQNFYQAQLHCQLQGKRVCTETEWTKACEGPDNKPFPYGYVRDPTKCRGDRPWDRPSPKKFIDRDPVEIERLWQGVVSGSQPDCVSDYGVHDMPGNADELAASETYGKGPKSDFDNVTTGGPWYLGVRNQCRPKIYSHDESFSYYYLSWRCCAEADGKPTDPRSPKQIKRGESWEKVLWSAKHSWLMPFNPRLPGDPDYAPAGPDRKPPPPKE